MLFSVLVMFGPMRREGDLSSDAVNLCGRQVVVTRSRTCSCTTNPICGYRPRCRIWKQPSLFCTQVSLSFIVPEKRELLLCQGQPIMDLHSGLTSISAASRMTAPGKLPRSAKCFASQSILRFDFADGHRQLASMLYFCSRSFMCQSTSCETPCITILM